MLKTGCILALSFALAACSLPRDPSGTMDRVEQSGTLRLGIVEGAEMDAPSRQTLSRVLQQTGSRPQVTRGDSDQLLARLKRGEIDLVFGELPMSSPWSKEVAFGAAQGMVGTPPTSEPAPRFAMMNGENGWIMMLAEAGT